MVHWQHPNTRRLASVLIIGHVAAVALAPLAFQTRSGRGNSPSIESIHSPVRGYGEFLYLNRGYAFFAPDPGPSHLFQASLVKRNSPAATSPRDAIARPDLPLGSASDDQPIYPDLRRQWPRLMYHRHFMLAEYLQEIYEPPGPPEALARIDPDAHLQWRHARSRYERVLSSYARHLEWVHPGTQVSLRRLQHALPDFLPLATGPTPLTDPASYRVLIDQPPEPLPDLQSAEAVPAGPGSPEVQPLRSPPTPSPRLVPSPFLRGGRPAEGVR